MKRFFAALFAVLVISFSTVSAFAQSPMQPPPYGDFPATRFPDEQYSNRSSIRGYPWMMPEDRVLKNGPLAPSKDDRMALKPFLRGKNTGLIRLLPRQHWHSNTAPVQQQLKLRGGGSYYSFAYLTHLYGYGSDIELSDGKLSVGFAGADYGLLINLGDQPLEQITLEDMRVHPLASYSPPRPESEARQEYQRLGSKEGLMLDGQVYRRRLPVSESATYLLRSISYSRSDVLVAFRVIRTDADGSVVIAWKLLKRYSPPKLTLNNLKRDIDRPW